MTFWASKHRILYDVHCWKAPSVPLPLHLLGIPSRLSRSSSQHLSPASKLEIRYSKLDIESYAVFDDHDGPVPSSTKLSRPEEVAA